MKYLRIASLALLLVSCGQKPEELAATYTVQTLTAMPLTVTDTSIPTDTPTQTSTITLTPTFTYTPTITLTPTWTLTPTETLTPTITLTPTRTFTPTLTFTPTAQIPSVPGGICIPQGTLRQYGSVHSVIDGDTIRVWISGELHNVRYIGMDTPEKDEYGFWTATERNRQLVEGKKALLVKDVSETDRYGRLLRYVIVNGIFVNYQLVWEGLANASTYPPDVACSDTFRNAERDARTNERGLWKPTPVPPPPPQPTSPGGANCSPCYSVCIPPAPPDLDCGEIRFRRFQVYSCDPHGFDGDNDGIGCER